MQVGCMKINAKDLKEDTKNNILYICVCRQKTERNFIEEFNKGKSIRQVIRDFGCIQCKLCKPYIFEIFRQRNGGVGHTCKAHNLETPVRVRLPLP